MIKVQDIVYVVYRAPDLDKMEQFLTDFGMYRAQRDPDKLYMRGAGDYPYIHVTEKGEPGFAAVGMLAGSEAELDEAARLPGSSAIETIDAPGGGKRVRMQGPDNYRIDLVHGIKPVERLDIRDPLAINFGYEKNRLFELQRPKNESAKIIRLGHCVLKFTDGSAARDWFINTLGMLVTDRLHVPEDPKVTLGTFMRCNRGDKPADHHTIFALHAPGDINVHHVSFEVQDPDAVQIGHYWLQGKGWKQEWGVGRHLLGSQVFDYWRSPWGHIFEHYADGDLLNASVPPGDYPATQENLAQWGPELSPRFFESVVT
ncbi:MAG TPA: glyoxalase [Beijerinckiaceae bacterium]|jgi:catechol 2,3-dioxygenase-like lactoylglutathione lyase family enzyme|nr:glyoxalase [Beijerinckiaceae bacterium]